MKPISLDKYRERKAVDRFIDMLIRLNAIPKRLARDLKRIGGKDEYDRKSC